MKDIVVLAGSTPWSVLSLCKCAYKYKVKTYAVCVNNVWGKKYAHSRYVFKGYDVRENELNGFWDVFFAENSFADKPILYVTNDYVCQLIQQNRPFYEQHFSLCMASPYIVESFIDKNKACNEAARHGLVVPKTKEILFSKDIDEIINCFQFPVIVKPVTFRDHSLAGFKTQICKNAVELTSFLHTSWKEDIHLQCQEYIPGEDKDCWFYQFYRNKDGKMMVCMGEKTLQTNGIMTIGTTKCDKQLDEICRLFLDCIDYVGIGGIEFKKYNGQFYFIEMSTRTEGFLPISDMAEVSLAEASFRDFSGKLWNEKRQIEQTRYVVFLSWLLNAVKTHNAFYAIGSYIRMIFSRKTKFVGSFLEWPFMIKMYTKRLK